MKPGDLYRISVPGHVHPGDQKNFDGMFAIVVGGTRTWFSRELVYCLVNDVPRFIDANWLRVP